jgi:hypothetical protein
MENVVAPVGVSRSCLPLLPVAAADAVPANYGIHYDLMGLQYLRYGYCHLVLN